VETTGKLIRASEPGQGQANLFGQKRTIIKQIRSAHRLHCSFDKSQTNGRDNFWHTSSKP